MNKQEIIQSIIDYLQNDKANYTVMLYGDWGSGNMKAIRQNMGLEEDDESADNEIMQMDKVEVFIAYCH